MHFSTNYLRNSVSDCCPETLMCDFKPPNLPEKERVQPLINSLKLWNSRMLKKKNSVMRDGGPVASLLWGEEKRRRRSYLKWRLF